MATTTNYSWTTPDDTALVKDGASAIRSLGTSIDTTTKALNPSTTLGDIEYRSSTANTNTRLGIGTSGQVLLVSGGVPAWGTISAGGMTSLASGSIAASATGIDISSISGSYNELVLYIKGVSVDSAAKLYLNFNNDSTTNYAYQYYTLQTGALAQLDGQTQSFLSPTNAAAAVTQNAYFITIPNYTNTSSWKTFSWLGSIASGDVVTGHSIWKSTSAITRVAISANAGSFDAGTYELFGVK